MTWNVWWRFGPWEQREPAILQAITDLDADVIALQEVWGDGTTNFAEKIADHLGYQHVFASSMDMRGDKFGNALLSRWPIFRDDFTMLFGEKETAEGRLALFAEVDGPRGTYTSIQYPPKLEIRTQQCSTTPGDRPSSLRRSKKDLGHIHQSCAVISIQNQTQMK